jgi:L-seryl-tRNA(Ser) seleniumtransferase
MTASTDRLRTLPSVSELLHVAQPLIDRYGHALTADALRDVLANARNAILDGRTPPTDPNDMLKQAADVLTARTTPSLRPVINATGVIIHTNLGRAPLSQAAIRAVQQVSRGYSTLEFDLDDGGRGSRNIHPEPLLTQLTGAEAALVVNNAASALVLVLSGLPTADDNFSSGG